MKSIASAKEAFKAAEKEYYQMAKVWAEIQTKALARISELESKIAYLKRQQKGINPYASQEESELHWDEIPHAINRLQANVAEIKSQLNA